MSNQEYIIVVGVDFSEASQLALERALEVAAGKRNVALHAVNVQLPLGEAGPTLGAAAYEASLRAARKELIECVARTVTAFQAANGATPFDRLVTQVRIDEPGHQLAQYASDVEADLVVVGTGDRHGIARLLMGSVAQIVARLAPCPVLIVRPKALPTPLPRIEPPCPRCIEARRESGGAEQWCAQHRERHGQRHTYHQTDRAGAETNFPLVGGG
jgi:nucleotide-binding universal stress UspA family protein